METVAYAAFWSGVVSTAIALGAGLTYALIPQLAMRSSVTNVGTIQVPVIITGPSWLKGEGQSMSWLKGGSQSMSWLSIAVLVVYMGLRWGASGMPPASNMWEYTVAFGAALVVGAGLVDWRYRAWGLSLGLLASALIMFAIAEVAFSSQISLPPAPHLQHLQVKHLLALHVGTMLVAFGAFGVAFVSAASLLAQRSVGQLKWLPSNRVLNEISDRALVIGFPFYTLGLAVGSYWMNSLWGRYWDTDAKAASSLATWFIFAGYFHVRNLRNGRGLKAPLFVLAGFATLMFSYFGLNLW